MSLDNEDGLVSHTKPTASSARGHWKLILGNGNDKISSILKEAMIGVTKSSQLHHQAWISKATDEDEVDKFEPVEEEYACLVKI